MWRKFCGWLLRAMGWTAVDPVAPEDKCIILGVPHTSIWDFVISYLYYESVGGKPYCMIKGEFFKGPLGWLLRKLGGIPVDRKNATTMLLSVIKEMKEKPCVHLALAPAGKALEDRIPYHCPRSGMSGLSRIFRLGNQACEPRRESRAYGRCEGRHGTHPANLRANASYRKTSGEIRHTLKRKDK